MNNAVLQSPHVEPTETLQPEDGPRRRAEQFQQAQKQLNHHETSFEPEFDGTLKDQSWIHLRMFEDASGY